MALEERSGPGSRKKRHSGSSTRSRSSRSSQRRKSKKDNDFSKIFNENIVGYAPVIGAFVVSILLISSGGKTESSRGGSDGISAQTYGANSARDSLYKEGILGQKCPWRGECGFGMECKNGICVLDHSKPWKHLRIVTDQGYCDCSAAVAVAHTIDDRRIAQSIATLSENDFTSIRYLRDCVTGNDYAEFEGALVGCEGGNVSGTFKRYKDVGAPYEWKVDFKMRAEKCDPGHGPIQRQVVRGGVNEHCLDIRDIKNQIKSFGPVLHHIKVHKELYSYPTVYSLQGPVKKEILEYDDFEEDEFDGFTTVEIAGFGYDSKRGVDYLVIKTSWGIDYGVYGGYLLVSEAAFKRFMLPKCGLERSYDWNGEHEEELKDDYLKFPILFYAIKQTDPVWGEMKKTLQHEIEHVLHYRRKRAMPRKIVVPTLNEDTLKVEQSDEEFPKLKYAVNSVFHFLKLKYRSTDYVFKFDRLVKADLSVVAGRRISLILRVYRNLLHKDKIEASDVGYVKAIVWIPVDSSDLQADETKFRYFEDVCDPNPYLRENAKYCMVSLEEVFERESPPVPGDEPKSTFLFKISVLMVLIFLWLSNNNWSW